MPTKVVTRKTITGRKVGEERTRIGTRDQIDQLLDAYRQFKMMTHILGLPQKAVSLMREGTKGEPINLSLTDKSIGVLGMYSYGPGAPRTINLPDRSNSFAHEWGHALDHWLMIQLREEKSAHTLFSGSAQEEGVGDYKLDNKSRVRGAFAKVLMRLYGDRAKVAAMQLDLQIQAAQIGKDGRPTPAAHKAVTTLEDMRQGKRPPDRLLNRYFKTSKDFDDVFGGKGYFISPAEMFARAYEAYVAARVSAISDLPQSFLNKGDWAYTLSKEPRARDTFPKGADADALLIAFDDLFHQIRNASMFGPDTPSARPADNTAFDMRQWDKYQNPDSLAAQERDAWRGLKRTGAAIDALGATGRTLLEGFHAATSTFGGYLHRIAARQENQQARVALRNILDNVVTDPGSGRRVGVVWEEAVERRVKRNINRLENIIKAHKIDKWSADEMTELRLMLTGNTVGASSQRVQSAGAALRGLMDEEWRYTSSSGIDVGYVRNGWLPRIASADAALDDPQGFHKQARKVFKIVFKNDVRNADFDDQVQDINRLVTRFRKNTRPTETGERSSFPLLDESDEELITNWRKARATVTRHANAAAKAAKEGDGDKEAAALTKLEEAQEALDEIHGEVLDMIEDIFTDEAATNWALKIQIGGPMDFATKGPDSTFLKKRTLPPETDALMIKFFTGDPLTLVTDYLQQAPRRVEYAKRFGADSDKLEAMLETAGRAGADGRDVREIRATVNILTGRQRETGDSSWSKIGAWVYVAGTVTLLKRATWSSLAEPLVAGMRTGNMGDSIRALGNLVGQIVGTGAAKDRAAVARVIGLVTSSMNETVMHNRFGGDFDPSKAQTKILSRFFRRSGLIGLTNLQRTSMMGMSTNAIGRMLRTVQEGSEKQKKAAREELHDLGIPDAVMADLREWMAQFPSGMPGVDDLLAPDGSFNKAAEVWAAATVRLTEQIIQNPKRFDRPKLAALNHVRMIYGIMGFTFAFHRNILVPLFKKNIDARGENETAARYAGRTIYGSARNLAQVAPAIMALFGSHLLVTIAREALFNRDRWDQKMEDDEWLEWILARAFSRTGLSGASDPFVQILYGLRYERDIASAFAGAHVGWLIDVLQDLLALNFRNSPNTDTTERNAVKTLTELVTGTGGNLLLSAAPGGPLVGPVYGVAMWASDADVLGEFVAEAIYGPDPKKRRQ